MLTTVRDLVAFPNTLCHRFGDPHSPYEALHDLSTFNLLLSQIILLDDVFILTYSLVAAVKITSRTEKYDRLSYIPISILFSFPFPSLFEAAIVTVMLLFMSVEGKHVCGSDEFKVEVVKGVHERLVRLSLYSMVKL